jgi:lipoprotein NlpD
MSSKRFSGSSMVCALLGALLIMAGCSSRVSLAPVEDRGTSDASRGTWSSAPTGTTAAVVMAPTRVPLGAENAGKPGYFTVRPGDTVRQIGRETGVAWQDIVRWNNLENPNQIEIGQVLRVAPPGSVGVSPTYSAQPYNTTPTVSAGSRPVASVVAGGVDTPRSPVVVSPSQVQASPVAPAPGNATLGTGDDNIAWIWPNNGPVVAGYDALKNKGLAIGGRAGDPVIAAADGVVVYAGSGLRGYGNLVILKHNNTYLTAYAHNQTLLVKEDQSVRKGQKIAEMGNSDADRVKLHFEVRKNGTPVDPLRYLPIR